MSAPNNPHNRAMDLVETAILERLRGNMAKTAQLYAEALELELVAIRELDERGERAEPTWSVLHRSAGWMAFNSHQFDMAAKLARKALAGNPHPRDCRGTARPDQRNPRTNVASHSAAL